MKKRYGKWFAAPLLALILASATWIAVAQEKQPEKPADREKVASVNGKVITQKDFDRDMGIVEQRIAATGNTPSESEMADMKKDVLENLINTELLYQESRKAGKKVDAAEVDKQVEALKNRFPSEEAFKIAIGKRNLSESEIRMQIERGLSIQKLIEGKFDNVTISEKETKEYYDAHQDLFKKPEQVKASHILIKVESSADAAKKAEARRKLEGIKERIEKGEDFAAMAEEFSEGPTGKKGGDLGYFGRGQMVKPFEEAAFSLPVGQMSGIVESPFGYHLIKVMDKRPAGAVPYDEIKGKIGEYLRQEKMTQEVERYIASVKEQSKVERFMSTEGK